MARTLDPANVVESKTFDELTVRPYGEDVMIATGKSWRKVIETTLITMFSEHSCMCG